MRKQFVKNVCVLATAMLLTVLVALCVGMGWGDILTGNTFVLCAASVTLIFEDLYYKMLKRRDLVTWQYTVACGLGLVAVCLFLRASVTVTWGSCILWLSLTLVCVTLLVAWIVFAYKPSTRNEHEVATELVTSEFAKEQEMFPAMNNAEVRGVLRRLMFCHLEGDCLEGGLDIERPFNPENDTLESLEKRGGNEELIAYINMYIDSLIERRSE